MFINSSRKFTVKSWMKCLSILQRPTWKLKEKLVVKLKSIPNLTNEHVPCYAPCCKMGGLKIITKQIVCMLLLGFGSVLYWAGPWTASTEVLTHLQSLKCFWVHCRINIQTIFTKSSIFFWKRWINFNNKKS